MIDQIYLKKRRGQRVTSLFSINHEMTPQFMHNIFFYVKRFVHKIAIKFLDKKWGNRYSNLSLRKGGKISYLNNRYSTVSWMNFT